MEGDRIYGGCNDIIPLLENTNNSPRLPPSPSSYCGTMVNFDQALPVKQHQQCEKEVMMINLKRQCCGERGAVNKGEDDGGDESDANLFGKKRRLSPEKVDFLEKCYETDNTLEPARKSELAKQIGLQPKQVSVWFQNRRARHKSKIVEKEFGSLKDGYNCLVHDNERLYLENQTLKLEVERYKKLLEKHCRETNTRVELLLNDEGIMKTEGRQRKVETSCGLESVVLQCAMLSQEAMRSRKSDIFNYETPHCTIVNQPLSLATPLAIAETSHHFPHPHPHPHHFPHLDPHLPQQQQEEHLMMTTNLLLPQTPSTINSILPLPEDDQPYGL